LAAECEYLDEKRCKAIGDSAEGKAARYKSCLNEFKDACCYSCGLKENCGTSCARFDKQKLSERDREVLGLVPRGKWSTSQDFVFFGLMAVVLGVFFFIFWPGIAMILGEPGAWLFAGVVLAPIGFLMVLIGFFMKTTYK
jgi:hypothetical protein